MSENLPLAVSQYHHLRFGKLLIALFQVITTSLWLYGREDNLAAVEIMEGSTLAYSRLW